MVGLVIDPREELDVLIGSDKTACEQMFVDIGKFQQAVCGFKVLPRLRCSCTGVVDEINHQLSLGAEISEEGQLVFSHEKNDLGKKQDWIPFLLACVAAFLAVVFVVIFLIIRKKNNKEVKK